MRLIINSPHRMLKNRFVKFVASSLLGFVADNIAFAMILFALDSMGLPRRYYILISLGIARLFSGSLNYIINRIVVFDSNTKVATSFIRYWVLVLLIAFASYIGTSGLSAMTDSKGLEITIIKVVVEAVLFIVSYRMQRKWVFLNKSAANV